MYFKIGKHFLGPGWPVFIVAEMSGNHGGSFDKAIEIVRAAKRAGADAIKLQTYKADTITLESREEDFRLLSGPWSKYSNLWDLYEAAHTPWEWHKEIFSEANKLGLEVFSSPFDETAVEFLEKLDIVAYKIASPEITHIPLLECVARTGKPIIISAGLADLKDIELALATLKDSGAKHIAILKCTTAYPAPVEESNLRTIPDIAKRFGLITGLSDHSVGIASSIAAVALGANIIEKHFTLDDSTETVDSFFSSGENEFTKLVSEIRHAEKALGNVTYDIVSSAKENIRAKRSIYISADVKEGEVFTSSNIKCVRPSFGLHPKYYKIIIGRRAKFAIRKGTRLDWSMIEDSSKDCCGSK